MRMYPIDTGPGKEPRHGTRVLVVDDNRDVAALLTIILGHYGYETATAYSGEEAIQLAASFQPQFILSDVIMGGMNGVEAVLEILPALPHCKVLFISGAGYMGPLEKARLKGLNFELLQKPFSSRELLDRISRILGQNSIERSVPDCDFTAQCDTTYRQPISEVSR
jgi:CheY-like chemotaxis protein